MTPRELFSRIPYQWGDHPGHPGSSRATLEASQALDRESRSRVRSEKRARDRLIALAESHPEWVVGFEDECWFSRFERPNLHSWAAEGESTRLVEKVPPDEVDPEPKALACYGMYVPELGRSWIRFVDGRSVSSITTRFLDYCCGKLAAAGKEELLLIWDNASWHKSYEVRDWIATHNRRVKTSGSEARVRIVPCLLPTKSPWPNPIGPKWIHSKRKVVEPERLLGAYELADRVCDAFGCAHEEHLSLPQEVV